MLSITLLLLYTVASISSSSLQSRSPLGAPLYGDISSETAFEDEILEFYADDVPFDKRDYTRTPRMISYTWEPQPSETAVGFNISMDVSGCYRSLKRDTHTQTVLLGPTPP